MVHSAQSDGSCDYFNQRWLDYLGVSLDDIKGWKWTSRIHPEDADAFVQKFRSSIRDGEPFEAKARVRRQDGVYRWMLHRKVPLRDKHGKIIKWHGSSIDIDELKRSEFYLAEGQRLSHVGSWTFNSAGFDHWSSELFKIHGLDPSAKAPSLEEYLALVHPEDRKFVAETIQKMFAEGRGFDFTKRIVRPDGEIRRVRCVGVLVAHGGAFQEFVGTGMDVTEQEQLTEELRRSEFYLAEGQRLAHAGSWSFKSDLTCDYWSRELYEILGFNPRNGIPTISDYFTRVHPEDRAVVEATIKSMIAVGEGCDLKKRIIRPDGLQRVIRCVGTSVRENGVVTRFVGTLMDITEQEDLIQELRRSKAYLAEAQRLSHTGSFGWKPHTGEIIWSAETYRIFEYDRAVTPTIGLVTQRIHPEDRADFQSVIERVSGGASDFEHTYRLLMPDGRTKHIHALAHATQDASGYREFVGAVTDITDQRRAEESLRKSEAYLADAQKLSRTGSWAWHPEAGITYWSEESYRVQGFDPRDGLPSSEQFFQRIHPDDQPGMMELMQRLNREKIAIETNFRIVHPSGAVRDIHSTCRPVFNPFGDFIEFIGTMIDVTERKRAEEELHASERKYRNLVDTTPAFVHTTLPNGDLDFINRGWLEYLGLSITDMVGWRWTSVIHPEDVEEVVAKRRATLESGQAFVVEARIRRADGKYRWFLHRSQPWRNKAGEIVKWYGAGIEIEERKRAEALLTGEKNLHEMIATGVALKDILNALCLMIEEQRSGTLASVLLVSPDGIHLESLAGPSLPEGWTRQIASVPIGPCAGSCGTAAYRESPVIVSDIATDPLWAVADHRASALNYGLRASWSYPILSSEGKVLGTFCQYYRETRSPSPSDLDLIELAAHLARVAIERKGAEEQLRRSEAFLADGQRLSHTGSWGWSAATGKLTWSQENFRILGFDPQDTTPSLDIFWERVHPDDRTALRHAFESAIRDKRDLEREYRIVTPDWLIRHLHGVGHAVLNEANELVEFIGSTVDITERKRAEERSQSQREAIRLALNAFVEELDVNRFLDDVIAELNKQFHAKFWELWLFDEAISALLLHSSSHPTEYFNHAIGSKNARPLEELLGIWPIKDAARAPQILELSAQDSLLSRRHGESLKRRGIKTLMIVPLVLGEQNLGFLELHFQSQTQFSSDDLELVQALVNHATLALQLNRLTRRAEQLAVTEERNRLAREIHDTLAQAFAGIVLHAEALGPSLKGSKARSRKSLLNIQKLARSGLEEARRSVQALRPKALDDRSLTQALEAAAQRLSEDAKPSCEFKQRGKALEMPVEVQNELFRVAQEAMTNVKKHAQAKSAWINLEFKGRQVILTIRDDGVGLTATNSPKRKRGYGLATMRERALRIGGKLEIESPDSGGTVIRVVVPLAKKLKPSNHSL
jgi:PAS domain S-box-containing protein